MTLCQVANTIQGKLLKKLSVDKNKLTYLEFKILKATVKLQARLVATKKLEVQVFFSTIINSLDQENDFVWVHSLRFIQDNLDILQAEPADVRTVEGAAQSKINPPSSNLSKKEIQPQESAKPDVGSAPTASVVHSTHNSNPPIDFSAEVEEVRNIKDTADISIKSMKIDKAFSQDGMRPESKKKLVKFSADLFYLIKQLSEMPVCVPGLIKDGIIFTILETILKIYIGYPKDEKLRKIAQTYATIVRKILAASSEATIKHFGVENCSVESNLRGHNHEILAKNYDTLSQEELLPLVEFLRVFRRNFQMKFLYQAVNDYGAFVNEAFQHSASGKFFELAFRTERCEGT